MASPQISSPSAWTPSSSDPWSSSQQPYSSNDDHLSPYASPFLGLSDFDNMSDHASSTSSSTAHILRVAIIGGGLGGAALLRGLMRYPHIAAELYDARPQFRDEGPALDLSEGHQEVLRALDPALDACLDRAGAVYMGTATTPHRAVDLSGLPIPGRRTVGRQALLEEILVDVPPYQLHPNTPIVAVSGASETEVGGGGAYLEFVDGTRRRYDVVIGADGTSSLARSFVISDKEDPAHKLVPSGSWTLPLEVPLARAQQAMGGAAYLDPLNPCRAGWVGDDLAVGDAAASLHRQPGANVGPSWAKLFTPEEFEATFAQNRSPACQGMVKLNDTYIVQSVYTIQIAGVRQNKPVSTAHPRAASRGAGARRPPRPPLPWAVVFPLGQAVLATLLGGRRRAVGVGGFTRSGTEAASPPPYYALQATSVAICRRGPDQVVRAASEVENTLLGRSSRGLDPVGGAEKLQQRWPAVHNLHVAGLQNAALDTMEQFIAEDSKW
ncbi:hypothetical protein PG987_005974 [Apiospora arundinis]